MPNEMFHLITSFFIRREITSEATISETYTINAIYIISFCQHILYTIIDKK
jgi:hypothetical protein